MTPGSLILFEESYGIVIKRMSNEPVRTCLGCGGKKPKGNLRRFVLDDRGVMTADVNYSMPGRGVYCCKSRECLSRLVKNKKRVSRAFRAEVLGYGEELESIFGRK